VLHFAASALVGESVKEPSLYYQNNIGATLTLLEAMRAHGVGSLIFSSTCATYGAPLASPIRETHPQQPINPYGRSKWMVEQILADYASAYGLRYLALRYFNVAGAAGEIGELHEPETHLVPLALFAAMGKREQLEVFGTDYPTPDGSAIRDYLHVEDLVRAHLLGLDYLLQGGAVQALNLGTGRGISVLEIIRTVERVTGRSVPVRLGARREGDPPLLAADYALAERELGWRPLKTLDEIVTSAWDWHTADRAVCSR
jgi:UDP-glucose-4-epimerase GalE